jgi:N-6 DNA Methylase
MYDPTCGSGSLLLKVADEAGTRVTLYGQEKEAATSGLARMNMILHDNPTALIAQANTLADPRFKHGDNLKSFDFVIASTRLPHCKIARNLKQPYATNLAMNRPEIFVQPVQRLPDFFSVRQRAVPTLVNHVPFVFVRRSEASEDRQLGRLDREE